jgi:hypothetical protein
MVNFAIMFVNMMGVFPDRTDMGKINIYDDVNDRISDLYTKFTSASNTFEYMVVVASLIINGLILVFEFIFMAVFGLPLALVALGLPLEYAALIATPIAIMILYEVGKSMTRVG